MSLPLNDDLAELLRAGASALEREAAVAPSDVALESTVAMVAQMRATADALQVDLVAEDDAGFQECIANTIPYRFGRGELTSDEIWELASAIRLSLKSLGFPPPSEPPPPPTPRSRWPNNIDWVSVEALEYLAENPRPEGPGKEFNAEHLFRIADELRVAFFHAPRE